LSYQKDYIFRMETESKHQHITVKRKLLPNALVVFHIVFIALFIINFPIGKYFSGWDNLHPEFDFFSNFRRSLFASWQENYGLGTIGGHGFAATLPHNIITYVFSFIFPIQSIRPLFTLLIYYLGGLGMFFLMKEFVKKIRIHQDISERLIEYIALFSALFYMLNLGTIQMFTVQLETFIANYAALPWLFLCTWRLIEKPSKKNVGVYIVVNFFSTLQGFIPSLFVAYSIALGLFLLIYFLYNRTRKSFKNIVLLVVLTTCINAYWLLPVAYYAKTMKSIYPNSNINLKYTEEYIQRNKKYGDIMNVPLIKGFIFDTTESPDSTAHIYAPWVKHQKSPLVLFMGYSLFGLTCFGLIRMLISKQHWIIKAFCGVFFIYFTGLTTNLPPFSFITNILQNDVPIFKDAFRTPFTKFAFGVAFSYSIFLGAGLLILVLDIKKIFQRLHAQIIQYVFSICFIALFIYSLPAFQHGLFAKKLVIDYPESYSKLFTFLQTQNSTDKLADLPQDMLNGWYSYGWGYSGSGFLWFGIPQPVLSRTFDVWSNKTEGYYWELTQAIREENYAKADLVFQKYDIKWVLYDENVIHTSGMAKGFLFMRRYLDHLKTSPSFVLTKTYIEDKMLPIYLFRNKATLSDTNIVIRTDTLPNVEPTYNWIDDDKAYEQYKTYISTEQNSIDVIYPFRSLFTKRVENEKEFAVSLDNNTITFKSSPFSSRVNDVVHLNAFFKSVEIVPVNVIISKKGSTLTAKLLYKFPEIILDGKSITQNKVEVNLGKFISSSEFKVNINGSEVYLNDTKQFEGNFYTTLSNEIAVLDNKNRLLFEWKDHGELEKILNDINDLPIFPYQLHNIEIKIPKIFEPSISFGLHEKIIQTDPKPCFNLLSGKMSSEIISDQFGEQVRKMEAKDNRQCLSLYNETIPSQFSYLLETDTENIQGEPFQLFVANKQGNHILNVMLPKNKQLTKNYFIVANSSQSNVGYYFTFMNTSHNFEPSINTLKNVWLWPIPRNSITSLTISQPKKTESSEKTAYLSDVKHPNETLYNFNFTKNVPSNTTIILTQSFHPGWKAYEMKDANSFTKAFPFLFGTELKEHILINNWANGWKVKSTETGSDQLRSNNTNIVIVFWPQYLQFIGFALIGATFVGILFWKNKK